jgi:hypothetical protein
MMKQILMLGLGCAMIASAQPSVVSISPLRGTGATATFTSVYHHPQGGHYLAYLLVLPTPNIVWFTAKGSCLVEYNTYGNNKTGGVRLIDDAGTGWHGGIEGVKGPVLSNSHCSVNTGLVQATYSDATKNLTVTVPLTFTGTFSGPLTTFIQEQDNTGAWTGMTQFGTWTAFPAVMPKPNQGVYISSITHPAYNTLGPSSVDVTFGHTAGLPAFSMTHILLADSIVGGTNRCHIIYFHADGSIKLVNDAGTDFVPQTGSYHQNSTCRIGTGVNNDVMTKSASGEGLRLHIPMLFNSNNVKTRLNIWANAFDNYGNVTHWLAPGQ